MGLTITGRMENKKGANTHYRLSDGSIVTRALAVRMREKGLLKEYHIVKINNVRYLRDNPDPRVEDNIDSQPLIIPLKVKPKKKWDSINIVLDWMG
jgi:hypothetical protein